MGESLGSLVLWIQDPGYIYIYIFIDYLCLLLNWSNYSDVTKHGWNDDGYGKKDVFPEEIIGLGFENV